MHTRSNGLDLTKSVTAAAVIALVIGAGGCSDDAGGGDGGQDGGMVDMAVGNASILAGAFQIRLVAPVPATETTPEQPGLTTVVGKVYDGATPSGIIWEEAAKAGACRLLKPRVPFCNTPCGGSAVCVENDRCQSYPKSQSVGTVKVKGVKTEAGATEFSMEPISNGYQPPAEVRCPLPAFAEGAELRVETGGGAYAPFAITARGIAPLELQSKALRIEPNQPIKLAWNAPGQAGIGRILVKLDISHHGGSKGMIECDADDTGTLELPAALLTQLVALGVSGYPTVILTRRAVGQAVIAPGRVELVVTSQLEHPVEVPGLVSCTTDEECPAGQKCQPDLACR